MELPGYEEDNCTCATCGKPYAIRTKLVGNFQLPGTDLAFPTAADKWAKDHERRARK